MPKAKTKKVVSKRFKITKNGKILRTRQMGRHKRATKSKAHIRRLKEPAKVSKGFSQMIRRFLPYGSN